eukprot:scaffold99906_cov73-Phaeocystis_antarctica.AAC.1
MHTTSFRHGLPQAIEHRRRALASRHGGGRALGGAEQGARRSARTMPSPVRSPPAIQQQDYSATTNRIPGYHPTRADCHLPIEALALVHLLILTLTATRALSWSSARSRPSSTPYPAPTAPASQRHR